MEIINIDKKWIRGFSNQKFKSGLVTRRSIAVLTDFRYKPEISLELKSSSFNSRSDS